jgi:hypothetical protein
MACAVPPCTLSSSNTVVSLSNSQTQSKDKRPDADSCSPPIGKGIAGIIGCALLTASPSVDRTKHQDDPHSAPPRPTVLPVK